MLAQKQPSFEECVIAHWSSDSAPIMYRGLSLPPKLWLSSQGGEGVGERSVQLRSSGVNQGGADGSENVGISSVTSVRTRSTVNLRFPTEG
jgi:hypothetical protein